MKPRFFSHTDRTLQEHLDGLIEVTNTILQSKSQKLWPEERLKSYLYRLIAFHDIGKATDFFQYKIALAIKANNPKFYSLHKSDIDSLLSNSSIQLTDEFHKLSRHSLFGAILSQSVCSDDSLELDHLMIYEIICRHHGNLRNFSLAIFIEAFPGGQLDDIIAKQLQHFSFKRYIEEVIPSDSIYPPNIESIKKRFSGVRRLGRLINSLDKNQDIKPYFKIFFLYSILLSADKGDVMLTKYSPALTRHDINDEIIDNYKKNIASDKIIDKIREDAYQTIQKNLSNKLRQNFFSITLPTGLGKTFAAYKAALRLKKEYPSFRIIYCLPFTSIIDQNGSILSEILNFNGISAKIITVHHHLSIPESKTVNEDDFNYQEAEYVTEGWENEIIITTFVQLFESIFTNRNRLLRKFHNLCNSIIILDEIQNIPPQYIEVIEKVFKSMAEYFNTKFFFVTATQPIILPNHVVELSYKKGGNRKYWYDKLNRIQIDQSLLTNRRIEFQELLNSILNDHKKSPDKSLLVICNTKAFSQRLFTAINESVINENMTCKYLSAALVPYHRMQIIDEIKNRKKPMVLVSTQVVEAGVDIDFDIVYRELAPMDSINQAAGRCNRNGLRGKGIVKLFELGQNSIYDSTLLSITRNILKNSPIIINEPQIYELNQEYFKDVRNKIQIDHPTSQHLLSMIYRLQFEKVRDEFKLIQNDYNSNAFFIPLNDEARLIWREFLNCSKIEDHFQRKAEIKMIMPKIRQFTVNIPEYILTPSEEEVDQAIIYRDNWKSFYSEILGFFNTSDTEESIALSF